MGIKYNKPLSNFKHPYLGYILLLLENYEKGLLPFPGTISDQPAQVIEMFSLIQNLKIEHQNKLNKQSEQNGRRNKN